MTEKYNGYSLNELKQTVLNFEAEELDLTSVPQALVNEFGYACLANSLLFKQPKIPEYNAEEINEYIQTNAFATLDSLIDYVKSLDDDINKLFAIFSYTANYIKYDTQSSFSDNVSEKTLEEIFQSSCAVSSGYVAFFQGMAKRVNLNSEKIKMKVYSNYGKGYGYDPLNPPKEANANHFSIYITIDDVPFISEPTWAAGYISNNKKFVADYNPHLFLIPLLESLCDHYPCGESKSLLPFEFPFEDFLKACTLRPFGKALKTETNPYVNFECKNGFLEQIYSCTYPINNISMNLYRKNSKKFTKISSDGITSYEIIQPKILKRPDRCRFKTNIAFPKKGFYKVELIFDSKNVLTYYVDNPVQSTASVPIVFNPFHDSKFIPIIPKRILSAVRHGVALIRFAVEVEHSSLLWDIKKLTDQNSFDDEGEIINREYGRYVKLTLPFDEDRYEDQLCVTFPSDGRYVVVIYLSNDVGSYENYTKYFFDVTGVPEEKQTPVNPVNFMFNGRTFAPQKVFDGDENEITIEPNQNCYLVDKSDQTIKIKTFAADDEIHLEFKREEEAVAIPEIDGTEGEFKKFKWSIPNDFGEYHLIGWINDKCCINLTYIYRNGFLREPSETEKALLSDLKSKTDLDESKVEMRRQLKEQKAKDCEGKMGSKCCLLI